MRNCTLLLALLLAFGLHAQEQPPTGMDYANFALRKEFLDASKKDKDVWSLKEHDCPEQVPEALAALFASVNKYSQSHLLAMVEGNMRMAMFALVIPEKQHFQASGMNKQNYVAIATCLGGFRPSIKNIDKPQQDYFKQVTDYLEFVGELEEKPYMHMGREMRFKVIREAKDLEEIASNPLLVGGGITLVGGHVFGDYSFIHKQETESRKYKKTVLENISKLKGSEPLRRNEYLDFPILFFTPMGEFRNGFGGDIAAGKSQQDSSRLYKQSLSIRPELTKLGKTAIKLMLNRNKGRRIAINTNNLSKEGRGWLLDYYAKERQRGDTIPYIMLNSAVHGFSWNNDTISNPDFQNSSYFSLVENAVAKEDLEGALASKGFIGITIYSNFLVQGTRFERLIDPRFAGSADYKKTAVQILLANALRCVEVLDTKEAWNHIGYSTGFDGINAYFYGYDDATDMKELRQDMLDYLSNPEAIQDLYSVRDIRRLMYGLSPQEITDKLFSLNAQAVTKRLLQEAAATPDAEGAH